MELDRSWLNWQPRTVAAKSHALLAERVDVTIAPPSTDPLLGLDADARREVEGFVALLGAHAISVVPRGAADTGMAGSLSWDAWRTGRRQRIFESGKITAEQAAKRADELKRERREFSDKWRRVSHGWAKWARWRAVAPTDAERFRMEREDGGIDWLLELAARRAPLGRAPRGKRS